MTELKQQIQPGDRAPDFVVPAVHEERTISLGDYRGRTPLLLGLFPGLYCSFCRRALAQMASTSDHLKSLGINSLAIVGTELDNARLYFRFRPTRLTLGVDPHLATHRSYGVPRVVLTGELMHILENTFINPTGELPEPLPVMAAGDALARIDGYGFTSTDQREADSMFGQMKGQFLIDRDGVVRWANIECAKEGLSGVGKFPSHQELVEAASVVMGGTATV
jgi:peroxiredoxin